MEFLKQMSSSSSSSSSSELGSPIHHHHQHYGHHLHRHRPPLYSLSSMSAAASAPYSSAPIISSVSPSPSSLNPSNLQYLMQEGLHQLANFSSATLQEMALSVGDNGNNENNGGVGGEPMSLPQSLQHRQYQLPPEQHTGELTTIMSMVMANGSISNPQQTSTPQYDESVFSLLTFRNALIITCYSLIILVSLTGNLLVCRVAFGTREMRTTTNLLIASLACSDIVMTVFNIPFNLVRILPLSWPFGDLVCVLVPLIQYSCVYVSTFTMTLIALHRLWTVRQRRSSVGKTSGTKVALTVLAIWLVALTLSLPHAAFNRVKAKQFNGRILTRCAVRYPHVNFNFPLLLTVEVFFTQYLLPLSITLVVYVKIARVIARQGQLICKLSDEKKRRQSEQKRRRIFMLALAVATFATCWMPINLYLFLVDSRVVHLQTEIFIMCHWFAMSSVCYNPIIYCWLNEKFRNGAKQTIRAILSFARFPMAEKHGSNLTNSTILSI